MRTEIRTEISNALYEGGGGGARAHTHTLSTMPGESSTNQHSASVACRVLIGCAGPASSFKWRIDASVKTDGAALTVEDTIVLSF